MSYVSGLQKTPHMKPGLPCVHCKRDVNITPGRRMAKYIVRVVCETCYGRGLR